MTTRRHDTNEHLRRFQLAYLLKGSVMTVDDLMPRPSAAPRKHQVRRRRAPSPKDQTR